MDAALMPVVELDLREGSEFRNFVKAKTDLGYGIVSFPRSGHNWLSRMLAEIIKQHCGHTNPAALGQTGGMGRYIGLKAPSADQYSTQKEFYDPFPVVYGSHGHKFHDGFDPSTKLYLWRGFRAVWKSTKKALKEVGNQRKKDIEEKIKSIEEKENTDLFDATQIKELKKQHNEPAGMWWGNNFIDCLCMWVHHRWAFRKSSLKIRYEHLQKDTHGTLRKICDHMGVYDISEEIIAAGVRAGSRQSMLEEQELYGSPNPFKTVNPDK